MSETIERRDDPRIAAQWPVEIIVEGELVRGETEDVSKKGLNVCCDDPLPMDQPLSVIITPPGTSSIEVTAKVVWSDLCGIDSENRTVAMGLCFIEISDTDLKRFEAAVSAQLE